MENTKGDAAQLCIIQFIHLRPETLLMVQKSGKLTSLTLGEYYYHEIQQGFTKTPSHGAWPPGIFFSTIMQHLSLPTVSHIRSSSSSLDVDLLVAFGRRSF